MGGRREAQRQTSANQSRQTRRPKAAEQTATEKQHAEGARGKGRPPCPRDVVDDHAGVGRRFDTVFRSRFFPEARGQRSPSVQHRPRKLAVHYSHRESSPGEGKRARPALQNAEQLCIQQKSRL